MARLTLMNERSRSPDASSDVRPWPISGLPSAADVTFSARLSSLGTPADDAHGEDIDSLTYCLTGYINFCVENTVYPPGLYGASPTASPGLPRTLRLSLEGEEESFCVWK
ncbi:hypothetical protein L3Q82_026181 [Scortum barcoo]|uniref:Uncharacterized protein n=1 Tax=Scortum barcoo TaxID=214431 RepID=A0ACB8WHR8_9TELE|nr:hypothetical protein L3Q82_026181 [Scortum barcoo]